MVTSPRSQVAAMCLPSGQNATARARPYQWFCSLRTSFLVEASHSQTNCDVPAVVAMKRPSGENVSDRTFARWPLQTSIAEPSFVHVPDDNLPLLAARGAGEAVRRE